MRVTLVWFFFSVECKLVELGIHIPPQILRISFALSGHIFPELRCNLFIPHIPDEIVPLTDPSIDLNFHIAFWGMFHCILNISTPTPHPQRVFYNPIPFHIEQCSILANMSAIISTLCCEIREFIDTAIPPHPPTFCTNQQKYQCRSN